MNEQELREYFNEVRESFTKVSELANFQIDIDDIEVEILMAGNTHVPTRLKQGYMAAYIFKNDDICFKVGKVGARSNARYQFQHYNPYSSRSNLARSILNDNDLNLNFENQNNVGEWIKNNITRINLLLHEKHKIFLLNLLEAFLQCRLKPRYEG